jgi:hypothetical protein
MAPVRSILLLVLLALASPARAALAVPASVEDLARSSEAVVRGRVLSAAARWSEDGRRIFTYAEVEVASAWRGAAAKRVQVVVPGGIVGDIGQRVDGMAKLSTGEEVVLFLAPRPAKSGPYQVAGHAQGKFQVDGPRVKPDLSGTRFVPSELRAGERRSEDMELAELERRVRAAR